MTASNRTIVAAALALALPIACGSHYFDVYRSEISANQQAIRSLKAGMSDAEVRSVMGEGEIVRYKKIYLVDPWRTEAFPLGDGTKVLILYYVTQPPRKYYHPSDDALTPVVLENDRLVGWGWSYLRRNADRYKGAIPPGHQ